MRVLIIAFTLLTTGAFADTSDAINRAIKDITVAKAVQAEMNDGYSLKNTTATLISYSFGDEGYSNQYIVSISFEKGSLPIDKLTKLLTVFVNTDTYGETVELLDSEKMAKAVRNSSFAEEDSTINDFFESLITSKTNIEINERVASLKGWGYTIFSKAQVSLIEGSCGVLGCDNRYLVTIYVSTEGANPRTTALGAIIDSNFVTGAPRLFKVLEQDFVTSLLIL